MRKSVVILGASGHGKVIADIIIKSGDNVQGFLDDADNLPKQILGVPVLGKIDEYIKYLDCEFIIAIGNAKIREMIVSKLNDEVRWYTAIHPSAIISGLGVEIGEGTAVMADAILNSGATIGKHCIINTGAIIEHDNHLEDYVHISPNATLAGTVNVGNRTHIGVGAVVRNNLNICNDTTVGAGAVVVKNITVPGVYMGVPAEWKKE